MERRLTTILAADVVGYSRLMGADEVGTLAALKALRRELIKPKEAQYLGRTVKLMGDGALMEFASVVDAVTFAVEVQMAMAERNAGLPEDQQIVYRLGLNIGDIIVEGADIYGDGVNVAARLEGLCEPGGICVSRNVYNQVKDKLDLTFEDLGEKEVKNIAEPVTVYRVLLDGKAAELITPITVPIPKKGRGRWPQIAAGIVLSAFAIAGLVWWQSWLPDVEPALVTDMAFPLPDKPSIAVLPFNNMSDDQSQDYFVDGMTEDLITDLSKISGLFVISRNSSFSYKGQQVKVRQVAAELGVRYVLEGSVRRAGQQVRINAQLIDAATGGQLWAERYDGTLADVFTFQDKVTQRIVRALALQLTPREAQQVGEIGTNNVAAHDAYLLGLSSYYRHTPRDNAKAAEYFKQAIDLDSDYTAAYTALAKVYVQAVLGEIAYSEKLGIHWRAGYAHAWRFLERGMGQPNADFHTLRSWLALRKHQHSLSIVEAEKAIELSPNDIEALEALAEALIYAGQPEAGIEFAQRAMRQNPTLFARPLYLLGLAEFALGHPDKAVEYLNRTLRQAPEEASSAGLLAAAYGELGHTEQAEAAFESFVLGWAERFAEAGSLGRSLDISVSLYPFSTAGVLDRLADGFRAAGARVGVGRYMPLHATNRLSGPEIKSLLFGREIQGTDPWRQELPWRQRREADGTVQHFGLPIHAGVREGAYGVGRTEDDMLCERWPEFTESFEICVVIFRIPEPNAQIRWGDFVMMTDTGPKPFSLLE